MFPLLKLVEMDARSMKKTLTRLVNIQVKNISAVDRAANGRTWLLKKNANGGTMEADAVTRQRIDDVVSSLCERFGMLATALEGKAPGAEAQQMVGEYFELLKADIPAMLRVMDGREDVAKSGLHPQFLKKAHAVVGKLIKRAESEDSTMAAKKLTADDYRNISERVAEHLAKSILAPFQKADTGDDVREEFIKQYLNEHPGETRATAEGAAYKAIPGLWERCRAETTVGKDGRKVSETQVVGIARKSDGAQSEFDRKVGELMAKNSSLDREKAMDRIYRENPGLYERVRAESLQL